MLNTSNISINNSWLIQQKAFIASLKAQPLILVLRPKQEDLENKTSTGSLFSLIEHLQSQGIQHIEIAWTPHPDWSLLVKKLQDRFRDISFGAASITNSFALKCVADLRLNYAMSPFWDINLQKQAQDLNQLLIPGVFSPTEIHQASSFGCRLVKLFPASTLGIKYLDRVKSPMNTLPFIIAAGGLRIASINPWLNAGYGAIAIGCGLFRNKQIDPLLQTWLKTHKKKHLKSTLSQYQIK